MKRRTFLTHSGAAAAGWMSLGASGNQKTARDKKKLAMVGTGIRGLGMWGAPVLQEFGEAYTFVGLCDINPGRLEIAKQFLGIDCPIYTDFDKMMQETKPDQLLVMTVDGTHHEFIIKGMEYGADIITEKPLTTDENKCAAILEAEQRTGRKITVTFNYRYAPHRQKIYELLNEGKIGKLTSVDFHWYLDVYHGADYFRRWHRLRRNSGSLLVHKASHHFDLLNWWINADPVDVVAYGGLEFYGKNGPFRHTHCRTCPHTSRCRFYFDITKDPQLMQLYVQQEKHDGYLRDGCVFREDIDIYDKMAVQIRYANQVQVSYSLTTYSPYEGYRISFNGTAGKLDAWIKERQPWEDEPVDQIELITNFGKREVFRIPNDEEGHGGGDARLRRQVFSPAADPYRQAAGSRDGAFACLIGIAARKSIDENRPVKITELTSLTPLARRP